MSWKLRISRWVSLLGFVAFSYVGVTMQSSMDVPLPDGVRVGFFGNDTVKVWRCSDDHTHYSVPYWSGSLCLGLLTAVLWLVFPRAGAQSQKV